MLDLGECSSKARLKSSTEFRPLTSVCRISRVRLGARLATGHFAFVRSFQVPTGVRVSVCDARKWRLLARIRDPLGRRRAKSSLWSLAASGVV